MFSVRALALAVLALAVAAVPAQAAKPKPKRENLSLLARTLVKSGAPGAVVYVRTPTATRTGVAGFADIGAHVTMRAADHYRIASVSKAFVSVVVLQLEAEGKLDIDDPVEQFLPGLVPNGAAISLRQLMNHTSGLFDYTADETFGASILTNPSRVWAPRELLPFGLMHAPRFAPGTNWEYSNTNYIVLGLVAEAVARKPLAESCQERIFGPRGLTSTSFPLDIALDAAFVHGYVNLGGGSLVDVAPLLSPTYAWAAGGIVSNARDVSAFYRGLFTGKVLRPVQLAEMKAGTQYSGTYGLGIEFEVTKCGRAYGHNGSIPGWRNEALTTADGKRQAVVMVNIDESRVAWTRISAFVERALCRG
jgi:D-alanyl-D-alanine carboxypeptidase